MKIKEMKSVIFTQWNGSEKEEVTKKIIIELAEINEKKLAETYDIKLVTMEELFKKYGEWELFKITSYHESENMDMVKPNTRFVIIKGDK